MRRALIVVDVQNDFSEGGSLPVAGAARVAHEIAHLLHRWVEKSPESPAYDVVVASKDHHVDPGDHWARDPDFGDSWPVHCRVGTDGEAFHPNLDPQPFDAIFLKGEHEAAYSAFEGRTARGTSLAEWLREAAGRGGRHLRPRNRPLRASDRDRRGGQGLHHLGVLDLCAGVAPETTEAALKEMRAAGVTVE